MPLKAFQILVSGPYEKEILWCLLKRAFSWFSGSRLPCSESNPLSYGSRRKSPFDIRRDRICTQNAFYLWFDTKVLICLIVWSAKSQLLSHVWLLESPDNSKRNNFFFNAVLDRLSGQLNTFHLAFFSRVSTCFSEDLSFPSSIATSAPFSAAILVKTRENIISWTLTLFLGDIYFSW